jgi:hypothetical protein
MYLEQRMYQEQKNIYNMLILKMYLSFPASRSFGENGRKRRVSHTGLHADIAESP